MKIIDKIVTFSCSNFIHVYEDNCVIQPLYPYKIHLSIEDAKEYLLKLNKQNIKIETYGRYRKTKRRD